MAGASRCGSWAARSALFGVLVMLFVFGMPFAGLRIPSELAPQEDRAMVRIFVTAPEGSSIQYLDRQLRQVEEIAMAEVENGNARRVITRIGRFRPQRRREHGHASSSRSISGTSATRAPARSPTGCASARRASPARAST